MNAETTEWSPRASAPPPKIARFPPKLKFLFRPKRYKVAYGGRGSAKSWNFARALIIRMVQCVGLPKDKQVRILCAREFQNSLKDSVHQLLCDQISAMGFDLGAIHAADQHSGAITPHLARLADDWLHAAAQIASADVENDFQAWKG